MWSGPRNISTAMMRAFENRPDCAVVDEPFYAAYLVETGLEHPAREAIIASQPTDWRVVADDLVHGGRGDATVFYQKHMAHHLLPGMDRRWMEQVENCFLIRDPRSMIASLHARTPNPTIEDTGLPLLYREAPLNGIWEGSGNVICLDILRTLRREPLAGEVLTAELATVAGQDRRFDAAMKAHMQAFPKLPEEGQARFYAESLATLLTASVLMRHAPEAVAAAYVATRLSKPRGRVAGAVAEMDTGAVLARLGPGTG